MDTLPLPPRSDLRQYKKRAKELVTASSSRNPGAVRAWAAQWLRTLARLRGVHITSFVQGSFDRAIEAVERGVREKLAKPGAGGGKVTLADARFLIARAHSFRNWREFTDHVEEVSRRGAGAHDFESGADAVVSGDLPTLKSLVRRNPDLVRARSAREHRATLLHYVAANGVEDFRQRTPHNAVEIARFLLEAGAEVDALANTYGGGNAQTTLNLLVSSSHPAEAGLQAPLTETLLDFGAAIDGLDNDGSPLMTALAFGYIHSAEALTKRGARIDNIIAAAALGRADLVRRFVADDSILRSSLVRLYWLRLSNDPKEHVERAQIWACAFGRTAVVEFLLAHGIDPAAKDGDGMTGLHCAAGHGHIDIVHLLLKRGAPLETKNVWGGTVLASTVYFALNQPVEGMNYPAVIEALLAAGADVRAVDYPTGEERMDEVLKRHGVRAG